MTNEIMFRYRLDINVKFMSRDELRISYDSNRVSQLFKTYDVVQIDSCMLPFINIPLVKFDKGNFSLTIKSFRVYGNPLD